MADAIKAPCSREFYKAYHIGKDSPRKLKEIIWIVLHDEEAATARAAATYFKSSKSGGSAHLCVDDNECYRCLANEDIPWGAPGANTQGFHIEQAGFAKWSAVIWRSHLRTLKRAAYKSALHCKQFDIPVQFCLAADLKRNKPGITTHREVSKAFDGDHSDPGPFYPTTLFMYWCRRYRRELE